MLITPAPIAMRAFCHLADQFFQKESWGQGLGRRWQCSTPCHQQPPNTLLCELRRAKFF